MTVPCPPFPLTCYYCTAQCHGSLVGGSPLLAPPKVTSMSPRSTGLICWGLVELSSAANPLGGSCQIIN